MDADRCGDGRSAQAHPNELHARFCVVEFDRRAWVDAGPARIHEGANP